MTSTILYYPSTGSISWLAKEVFKESKQHILLVMQEDQEIPQLKKELDTLIRPEDIVLFPAWDNKPYDQLSPHPDIMRRRLKTLFELSRASSKKVVITTYQALMQKVLPPERVKEEIIFLKQGQEIKIDDLVQQLVACGYNRSATAQEAGDFALRGSIVDIVAENKGRGLRLDFFGNTLERIKTFDPATQLSDDVIDHIIILPSSEAIINELNIENFCQNYRIYAQGKYENDLIYINTKQKKRSLGFEHYLGLLEKKLVSLFDYLGEAVVVYQGELIFEEIARDIRASYTLRLKLKGEVEDRAVPAPYETLYLDSKEAEKLLFEQAHYNLTNLVKADAKVSELCTRLKAVSNFFVESGRDINKSLTAFVSFLTNERGARKVVISCSSEGSKERLKTILFRFNLHLFDITNLNHFTEIKGKSVGVTVLPIKAGFSPREDLVVISEADLIGERQTRRQARRTSSDNFLQEVSSFNIGELLVHKDHGIGRFEGLQALTVNNVERECLLLIYENNDKLYVPVENIDLLTRYGTGSAPLDRLGAAAWQIRKAKLKKRVEEIAGKLMEVAAARKLVAAPILMAPEGSYDEFCARFSYIETEDQLRAIEAVQNDLASGQAMDRLICGDVGFGKTEVALRAIFISIIASKASGQPKQVVLLAPTTLLVRQHYLNCCERFQGFPVKIAQLSRLVSPKESKLIKEQIEKGEIDLIIGTHALLAETVKFKDVGLLVIDEEQHFGVKQKEKLKSLKEQVHVLTLSATPIPRTLQMSMAGIKELSIISTPPVDRLIVKTFVSKFDPIVIKQAIEYEKNRGGKTFYIAPRLEHLAFIENKVRELLPEIKYTVLHGKVPVAKMEEEINRFYDGKYDLLIGTNIVESGLDVPGANTIIIHSADLFGVAQLHQLRGRVGRGKIRAYAYMYYSPTGLTEYSKKRLSVLQKLDSLGAGFTVASHDMDIRGYGNLLGEEQSGNFKEVGIELYQEMLEEALAKLQTKQEGNVQLKSKEWSPQLNLGVSVYISTSYIADFDLRLSFYQRLSKVRSREELENLAAEMIDRFGPLPNEITDLINIIELKQLAYKAYINKIETGPKGAIFSFHDNTFPNTEQLIGYVAKHPVRLKLRSDNKLVYSMEWKSEKEKFSMVAELLRTLASFC